MIPSPAELKYFLEVTKTLNFSRAAERIGISQPSLTMAIRRLEESVGAPLFLRHQKGVELTRQGRSLSVRAGQLLQSWEALKIKVAQSVEEVEGVFTLGCHPSVALYSLSLFLPEIIKKYPRLEIKLHHDLSRRINEDIISSRLDLGIVVNPVRHPDLIIHRLCYDQVTLWHGKGMNLRKGLEQEEQEQEAQAERVLICDPELLQSQELLKKLKRKKMEFKRILSTSSLEVVAKLTAHGGGIGLLPGRVAQNSSYHKLVRLQGAPYVTDEICLVYRVENKNIQALRVLSEVIRASFPDSTSIS